MGEDDRKAIHPPPRDAHRSLVLSVLNKIREDCFVEPGAAGVKWFVLLPLISFSSKNKIKKKQ